MSNELRVFAKQLRSNMTDAEQRLWRYLRAHRFEGAKFKRQHPLGNYIVDFICFNARIVIEVDGSQHRGSASDVQRDEWLSSQGLTVLRFWNHEVLTEIEHVLERIAQSICIPLSPTPLPQRGEGVK